MKKVILIFLFVFSALIPEKIKANYEEVDESTSSSNEVSLPTDYFSSSSSSQDDYQEQSTTEGPDGPPAPIDDWVPVLFILGIALVGKQYLRTEKRV